MRKSIIATACMLSSLLLACGIWGFAQNQSTMTGFMPPYTSINGVDCSGQTLKEAHLNLTSEHNRHDFVVIADGSEAGTLTNLHFDYHPSKILDKALTRSCIHPALTWLMKELNPYRTDLNIDKVNDEFVQQFKELGFINTGSTIETKNAYIDMTDTNLPIVPEVYGSTIDQPKLLNAILAQIERGNFEINIETPDYYVAPTVFADDPELLAKQALYRKYLTFQITYDFGYYQEIMTPQILAGLLRYNQDEVVVDEQKAADFIRKMAAKYDSANFTRTFYNEYGTKVTVFGGNYGYLIDQDAEIQWLTQALHHGDTLTRLPKYKTTARSVSNSKYGSSYVEIDLTRQHLWIYKDDVLVLSTPVVTGNVAKGTPTPAGSYHIYYMQEDRVLRGKDWDGSTYETPVSYWMAFNRAIGLHDAPWRSSFGGTIYKTGGSHGCINMPPRLARTAYSLIYIGYPVHVHY